MGFFVDYLTVGGGIAYTAELKFAQPSAGPFAAAITGTGSVLKNWHRQPDSVWLKHLHGPYERGGRAAVGGRHSRRQPHRRARRGGTRRRRLDPGNGTLLTFTDFFNTPAPFVEDTTIFAMINYSGAWNGCLFTYGGTPVADGSRFSVGSQWWEIDYNRTSSAGLGNFTADYLPSSSFVTAPPCLSRARSPCSASVPVSPRSPRSPSAACRRGFRSSPMV